MSSLCTSLRIAKGMRAKIESAGTAVLCRAPTLLHCFRGPCVPTSASAYVHPHFLQVASLPYKPCHFVLEFSPSQALSTYLSAVPRLLYLTSCGISVRVPPKAGVKPVRCTLQFDMG